MLPSSNELSPYRVNCAHNPASMQMPQARLPLTNL